jgi:radical SAM protein with 4Fe4S-binding SPASM domain
MIDITKLYCGTHSQGDFIRYGSKESSHSLIGGRKVPKAAGERRPVTVWNSTRTCNLSCIHCYTDSEKKSYPKELSTEEAKSMLDDLANFEIPALLISGGEPLMRKDLFELVSYAVSLGIRPTLSTNGTLITKEIAKKIKDSGFTYVGISLDGIGETNDKFRGEKGAFKKAMNGFRNCVNVGQRVGLRMTLTKQNYYDLHKIFGFIEREGINRACFYHLVYSGRGVNISADDLSYQESRTAMDIILERTEDFYNRGLKREILTVDNHVDGIYLYMKLKHKSDQRAKKVLELLEWNGGGAFSSGVGIANIDFEGNVHPDQFWMHYTLGNIRERKFSEIWMDTSNPLMAGLKNKKAYIKGRCSQCKWLDACGGSLRVRADLVYNDPWAPEPSCYLTDEEIGLTEEDKKELMSKGEVFNLPAYLTRKT